MKEQSFIKLILQNFTIFNLEHIHDGNDTSAGQHNQNAHQ
ncbi:hypothetical protein NIES4075_61600 [Tolypothrix sp. NIES-4075]|nr:hypothetical protein NIES4075_61600 [Tolypothrix sp. NIES-4075]